MASTTTKPSRPKTHTPKKRRPRPEQKQMILDIAEEIVVGEGLTGVTARRLAKEADCAVGTIYNLFDHLDDVIRETNLRSAALLQAALEAAEVCPETADPAEARLIALAEGYFDFAIANPNRWRALFEHQPETPNDPRFREVQENLFDLLIRASGVDGERPTKTQVRALRALWASIHGVAALAVGRNIWGETDAEIRAYAAIVVRAGVRGHRIMCDEGLT